MPTPNKGEKQEAFIERCMGDAEANKTFPDAAQRDAFCHSQWREHTKKQMADNAGDGELGTLPDREIFSVGTWKGSRTVKADTAFLDKIVESYNGLNSQVEGYAIPIKLGHNKTIGAPAMGYAENVRREGKKLMADFTHVPPEIMDAIDQRRYNAVSVELWPEIEHDGQKFEQVLSGVALLGAEWPAVKGLKPLYASHFAAEGAVTLSEKDASMTTFTQEQHDAAVAVVRAEMTAHLTVEKERADRAEAALSALQDAADKAAVEAIIEAAEKDGKIVPATKPAILAFAETLRKAVTKKEDRDAAVAQFKAFVEALPKRVDFKEHGRSDSERLGDDAPASQKVDALAKAKMSENSALDYRKALDLVFAEHPALKDQYAEENR